MKKLIEGENTSEKNTMSNLEECIFYPTEGIPHLCMLCGKHRIEHGYKHMNKPEKVAYKIISKQLNNLLKTK